MLSLQLTVFAISSAPTLTSSPTNDRCKSRWTIQILSNV